MKRSCETCGRAKDDGRRECATCRVRRYRQDPEKRERDRERSRNWKARRRLVPSTPGDRTSLETAKIDPGTEGTAPGSRNQEGSS